MKKQFMRTVSVLLFMAVLLPLASCKSEGQSALRQEFVDNGKNQPYSQKVPLQEMDFDIYNQKYFNSWAAGAHAQDYERKMILPSDIEYYENKNDSEPALVLKKGTEVYMETIHGPDILVGYGLWCWPDYEAGWRYGEPFTDRFVECQYIGIRKKYFVKTEQLIPVADEFYHLNDNSGRYSPEEFRKRHLLFMDRVLYLEGAFCSSELEANYSRREELSG